MRIPPLLLALAGLATFTSRAADPDVRVIMSTDLRSGVYGRVEFGNAPPPPLVYAEPVIVARPPPRVVVPAPIYLHVPPGHAKHWSKHCAKYNACGRPVYFVKSEEYEPKGKGRGKGKGHGKGRGRDDD
ncbi:MAG: hypothetical protein ACM3SO_15865 [Betaproteobacteria bacterium]